MSQRAFAAAADLWERTRAKDGASAMWLSPGDMAAALDPAVVQRPHLQQIDDVFVRVLAGEADRVIITTPPQVGKTQRAAVWGPFWWLAHRPNNQVLLVSYGADLARGRGRMVRRLVREYGAQFGLHLSQENSAANEWSLTAGGGMRTGGVGSGITGFPGDCLIIDDPHKDRSESDSHAVKEGIWDTYSSSLLSRLAPGAPVILIQTRWAPDDLAGRVLAEEGAAADGGRWHVLHMPAIADPRFGPDPLGRAPGQPLPHPRIDLADTAATLKHWEEKRRTSTVRDWAALYQGDPRPSEGALITEEQLRAQRHYHPGCAKKIIAVGVDPSGGGRDEAGVIGGFLGGDGRLHWTHDLSGTMSSDQWGRVVARLAYDTGADRVVAEKNYGGDMVKLVLRTSWETLSREAQAAGQPAWGLPPRIVLANSKRGKLLRAEPIAQQLVEDRIRIAAPLPALEAEWCDWRAESGWSPGRIDASVHLAYSLLPIPGSGQVVSSGGSTMALTSIA